MISLTDMVGLSGLSEEEILAIAEHEHMPPGVAAALAAYLGRNDAGLSRVRDMIIDDIRQARLRGDLGHARDLMHTLHHFLRQHPEAVPQVHPWSAMF